MSSWFNGSNHRDLVCTYRDSMIKKSLWVDAELGDFRTRQKVFLFTKQPTSKPSSLSLCISTISIVQTL